MLRIWPEKTFTFQPGWITCEGVSIHAGQYPNNRLVIQLMTPLDGEPDNLEPFATATVNMPDEECPENEVWVKDWSENEGMTEFLKDAGVIERTPTCYTNSGFVVVKRYRLTAAFMTALGAAATQEMFPRQRGRSTVGQVIALAVAAAFAFALGDIDVRLDRIEKKFDLTTCRTDFECQRACEALGGGSECADVLGELPQ